MSRGFTAYDKRHYRTVGVLEGYRLWSQAYDEMMTEDLDLALLRRLGSVDFGVEQAIDLACGTGRIGAWLASVGARTIDDDLLARSPGWRRHAGMPASFALAWCAK